MKNYYLGKIIRLPFNANRAHPCHKDKSLQWFLLMRSPLKEWSYMSPEYAETFLRLGSNNEFYAVQHFDWKNAEKKAKNWRKSHKKERILMKVLSLTMDSYPISNKEESIEDIIYSHTGSVLAYSLSESIKSQCTEIKDKCGDFLSLEWDQQSGVLLAKLTPKGFNAIKKLLPQADENLLTTREEDDIDTPYWSYYQ